MMKIDDLLNSVKENTSKLRNKNYLRGLNNNDMRRQVNAHRQRARAEKHRNMSISKGVFHQTSIRHCQSGMMKGNSLRYAGL